MTKMLLPFLAILMIVSIVSIDVQATSLWGGNKNFYADQKARGVGDLLTVLIMEHSKASQEAATDAGQSFGFKLDSGTFLSKVFPGLSPTVGDQSEAHGKTTRSGAIIAQITVSVVDVLSTGLLLVEGTKSITVNGENEIITLSGIVRAEDIEKNNTVDSSRLADVSILYKGKGVIGNKQKPSPLEWLLNLIF